MVVRIDGKQFSWKEKQYGNATFELKIIDFYSYSVASAIFICKLLTVVSLPSELYLNFIATLNLKRKS